MCGGVITRPSWRGWWKATSDHCDQRDAALQHADAHGSLVRLLRMTRNCYCAPLGAMAGMDISERHFSLLTVASKGKKQLLHVGWRPGVLGRHAQQGGEMPPYAYRSGSARLHSMT